MARRHPGRPARLSQRSGRAPGTGSRPDTSQATTLGKLDRIAAGHPAFFEALGAFAASDSRISIVVGNHDIELIRASTRDRFLELVSRLSRKPHVAGRITFHPWIYYVPGLLYAEHGSQYHDLNAFRTLLSPYRRDDDNEIDLPLGSRLSLYLIDLIESIEPRDQDVKPPVHYLLSTFKARPDLLLRSLRPHASFLEVLLRHAIGLRNGLRPNRRSAYEVNVLGPYSQEIGLRYETVVALDRLAATSPFLRPAPRSPDAARTGGAAATPPALRLPRARGAEHPSPASRRR